MISNSKGLINKCENGYNPINLDMSKISLLYTEHLSNYEEESKVVLKDLNIAMMVMIRDESKKFVDPVNKPLIKFKISTDEIKLFFTPITYRHLVNISSCFKSQLDADSTFYVDSRAKENKDIIKEAQLIIPVKKKGSTFQYWYQYVAVLSGSYIYFYPYKDK